jgi:hypothetical protein
MDKEKLMEKLLVGSEVVANGCREWRGGKTDYGYGRVRLDKTKKRRAHRMMWMLINGEISEHQFVLHKCDNRLCINPEHLMLGNQSDNMTDMVKKGRHKKGEGHSHAKLNDEKVREIRRLAKVGQRLVDIAEVMEISPSTIHSIVNYKAWKHVADEPKPKVGLFGKRTLT